MQPRLPSQLRPRLLDHFFAADFFVYKAPDPVSVEARRAAVKEKIYDGIEPLYFEDATSAEILLTLKAQMQTVIGKIKTWCMQHLPAQEEEWEILSNKIMNPSFFNPKSIKKFYTKGKDCLESIFLHIAAHPNGIAKSAISELSKELSHTCGDLLPEKFEACLSRLESKSKEQLFCDTRITALRQCANEYLPRLPQQFQPPQGREGHYVTALLNFVRVTYGIPFTVDKYAEGDECKLTDEQKKIFASSIHPIHFIAVFFETILQKYESFIAAVQGFEDVNRFDKQLVLLGPDSLYETSSLFASYEKKDDKAIETGQYTNQYKRRDQIYKESSDEYLAERNEILAALRKTLVARLTSSEASCIKINSFNRIDSAFNNLFHDVDWLVPHALQGKKCNRAQFIGLLKIGYTDFYGVDFSGVNLCNLKKEVPNIQNIDVDFSHANLMRTSFTQGEIGHFTVFQTRFDHNYIKGLIKKGCKKLVDLDLRGIDLSGMVLSDCDFSRSNLSGANLSDTAINHAKFNHDNLEGADLTNCFVNKEACKNSHYFNRYQSPNFNDANLKKARFHGVNLSGANLRNVDLRDADFSGACLYGANFRDANLIGTCFKRAFFDGAENFDKTTYANLSNLTAYLPYCTGDALTTCKLLLEKCYLQGRWGASFFTLLRPPHYQEVQTVLANKDMTNFTMIVDELHKMSEADPVLKRIIAFCRRLPDVATPLMAASENPPAAPRLNLR